MRTPLISVIVPVYNSANYLQKCLDSIVCQTYKKIEIILVDDGSTDNSPHICDSYAKSDHRVVVVHQPNSGAVGARKTGFEKSTGNYIMFVDSDDWISLDMCLKLIDKAEKGQTDIVTCDYTIVKSRQKIERNCMLAASPDELLHKIIRYQYPSVLWNKLYKRDLAKKSLSNCVTGDDVAEDFLFTVTCMLLHPSISYVPESLYFHNRDVESSLISSLPTVGKALYKGKNNLFRVHEQLIKANRFDEFKNDFYRLVLNVKTYLLHEGRIKEARDLFPEGHKEKSVFNPIAKPIRWIYYGAMNWGIIGLLVFKLYFSIKRIVLIPQNQSKKI